MSNSSRWRRLCEWVRFLQDTGQEIDLNCLVVKMEEIKRNGRDSEGGYSGWNYICAKRKCVANPKGRIR